MRKPSPVLVENGREGNGARRELVGRIIATYSGIIKLYALVRFKIIHLRFLEEIEQYLPQEGTILDLGCGFGLFSLYMALCRPRAEIVGLDVDPGRLQVARSSALKLGALNVSFVQQDLRDWAPDRALAAAYALDIFHHIPVESGNRLLDALYSHLEPGGRLLLKDIDTNPRGMLLFSYILDLLMSPRDQHSYRSASAWQERLARTGFAPVHLHYLWDVLPYPHILLICSKAQAS